MIGPTTERCYASTGVWVMLVLYCCNSLGAQIGGAVSIPTTLPGKAGSCTVAFNYSYRIEGASVGSDGWIMLPSASQAYLHFEAFTASGPDSAKASKVGLRIELPEELSGSTIFLNDQLRSGRSRPFTVDVGRLTNSTAGLFVSYRGMVTGEVFADFGRRFALLPELATLEATTQDSVEVVEVVEEIQKPAFELDYEQLSPEGFIDKWPEKEQLVARAMARIPLMPQVVETGTNIYEITFARVRAVRLDSVTGGNNYEVRENEQLPGFAHRIVVAVSDTGVYQLHLTDTTKLQPTALVALDNLLGGEFTDAGDTVTFRFRGGNPPYQLLFLRRGAPLIDQELGTDTVWQVPKTALYALLGHAGEFGLQLTDVQRAVTWNFGGQKLELIKPAKSSIVRLLPYLIAAVVLLLFLPPLIRSYRRARRRATIRKNIDHEQGDAQVSTTTRTAAIQSSRFPDGTRAQYQGRSVAGKFKITRRPRRDGSGDAFHPDLQPTGFLALPLGDHWQETNISTLLFGRGAIAELDEFLRRENTSKIVSQTGQFGDDGWERNEPIPEIGGMLMGQYRPDGIGDGFRVSVEKFVPLQARLQNVVKVEIDPMSLARDLSLAQDENVDLTVVGWFHTHPGHGLFLSQPDLKVQYGHFRRRYHFAMEIDSISSRLDTAFFTYRPDGAMNNTDTRRPGTEWFSWTEIDLFTRQNPNP